MAKGKELVAITAIVASGTTIQPGEVFIETNADERQWLIDNDAGREKTDEEKGELKSEQTPAVEAVP